MPNVYGAVYGTDAGGTYADPGDVESGVDRGDGTLGTLVVPTAGNVANGVGYGADGTEFTGTLLTGSAGILVQDNEDFSVIRGDDYANADGRAVTWTGTTANQWPDLTGATLIFGVGGINDFTPNVDVVSATGTQSFRMELTATETNQTSGRYPYDVQATLSGGNVVTLARGFVSFEKTYTDD